MRLVLMLALLLQAGFAQAWNAAGHTAVAAIAESRLSPAAKAEVSFLLEGDLDRKGLPSGRRTLAEIASWADEIRSEAQKFDKAAYKGWHVRANQVCADSLGPCKDGLCVDQLVIKFADQLADRTQTRQARNEALKWVVHLVGDLHMPLHSGVNQNKGGARVRMEGYDTLAEDSFHAVWDSELLEAALAGWVREPALALELSPLLKDSPTHWMQEARDVALHALYEPLPDFRCGVKLPEPFWLDAAYQRASVKIVRRQIERAAARLAQLLEAKLR